MLLQRLKEYAEQERDSFVLPPTLYSERAIRYVVDLHPDGSLDSPSLLDTADPDDRATRRGVRMMVPSVKRSSEIKPLLLADTLEYTLGVAVDSSRIDRAAERHRAYKDLVERCAIETQDPSVRAVAKFLGDGGVDILHVPDDTDMTASVTFRVDGRFPINDPGVQAFWASVAAGSSSRMMQCIVCHRVKPVLDRLDKKIKGVPGGLPTGTSLISANSTIFESYGLRHSQIAPTCADCGEKFTEALNHLLRDQRHHVRFGGTKVVFWTRVETGMDWGAILNAPGDPSVREQVRSLWRGGSQPEIDDSAFYGASLSGSGGRVVVRDWLDTTVGSVRKAISHWFTSQAIAGRAGEAPAPVGIFALASSTVMTPRDISPNLTSSLVRSALHGVPVPKGLLYQAVKRNRVEQRVTRPRAALIKLVLVSNSRQTHPEDYMVDLDTTNHDPAYLCGRLLYVLENAQTSAVGSISSTIVDRYYGTASSAPASVFSRLMRGAQPHLSKLRRDNTPAYWAIQRSITEIVEVLPSFPKTLTLEGQGLFALGFYHQRASHVRQIQAARGNDENSNNKGEEV